MRQVHDKSAESTPHGESLTTALMLLLVKNLVKFILWSFVSSRCGPEAARMFRDLDICRRC